MDPYVVDTSIVVKWFNTKDENFVSQAQRLLHDAQLEEISLFTPDLAVYELSNALLKGKKLAAAEVYEGFTKLLALPVAIVSYSTAIVLRAASFAEQYNLSVYDATFLAFAAIKRCPLITENVRHQGIVKEIEVMHIKDYPLSSL